METKGKNQIIGVEKVFWKTRQRGGIVFRCSGYDFRNVFLWSQFFSITPSLYHKVLYKFLLFVEKQIIEKKPVCQMEGVVAQQSGFWKIKIVAPSYFSCSLSSRNGRLFFQKKNLCQVFCDPNSIKILHSENESTFIDEAEGRYLPLTSYKNYEKINDEFPLEVILLSGQKKEFDSKGSILIEDCSTSSSSFWGEDFKAENRTSYTGVDVFPLPRKRVNSCTRENLFATKRVFFRYLLLFFALSFFCLFLTNMWIDIESSTQKQALDISHFPGEHP